MNSEGMIQFGRPKRAGSIILNLILKTRCQEFESDNLAQKMN
jgi:hypothetical protein